MEIKKTNSLNESKNSSLFLLIIVKIKSFSLFDRIFILSVNIIFKTRARNKEKGGKDKDEDWFHCKKRK